MKVTPSADRVVIERIEPNEKITTGGIVIPATNYEEYKFGRVVAVGKGPCGESGNCEMNSKPGDYVLYPPSLGRIQVAVPQGDGSEKTYDVIRQHEITLTLEGNPVEAS